MWSGSSEPAGGIPLVHKNEQSSSDLWTSDQVPRQGVPIFMMLIEPVFIRQDARRRSYDIQWRV